MSNGDGQDPQNPFGTAPIPAVPKKKVDAQNPFTDAQNPFSSSTIEPEKPSLLDPATLKGYFGEIPKALYGALVEFPAEVIDKFVRGEQTVDELKTMRDQIAKSRPGLLPIFNEQIQQAEARDVARAGFERTQDIHTRYLAARRKAGLIAPTPAETESGNLPALDRYTTAIQQVFGLRDLPPATPEEGRVGALTRLAISATTALPAHMLTALFQAQSNEQAGAALADVVTGVGLVAHGGGKASPSIDIAARAADYITGNVTRMVATDLAGRRVLDYVTRNVPLPVEGEQAGIKARLLQEEAGDVSAAVLRAHSELTPYGTTIIPGVERIIPEVMNLANERGIALEHYKRPDGLYDVALVGDKSPLALSTEADKQFGEFGFFAGQEVSYQGKPYELVDFGAKDYVLLKHTDGTELAVPRNEIRRPPYVAGALPLTGELHVKDYTVGDVMDIMGDEKILDPVGANLRKAGVARIFDDHVASLTGGTPSNLTTGELGAITRKFAPGLNVVPLFDRSTKLGETLDGVNPEGTAYLYADPTGKPIATMELATLLNMGFPEVSKQITAGIPEPVHGKITTAVTGFLVDPRAPAVLQARAALELMKKAGDLGVTQLHTPVDEVGARLAARYMNDYFPKRRELSFRARVQELAVSHDELYKDFKHYWEAATKPTDKVVGRFEGTPGVTKPTVDLEKAVPLDDPTTVANNNIGFDKIVKTFAKERGFLPEEIPGLSNFLASKMAKEARELYLTPDELAIYNKIAKRLAEEHGSTSPLAALSEMKKLPLDYLANSNDMLAQWTPNGVIEVRARESGELLGRFRNEDSAREFINSSGQAEGPNLDGGGTANDLPPGDIGGGAMPPAPPRPPTNDVADGLSSLPPGGRIPKIIDWIRTTLEYLSPMEGWISAIDNTLGSNFSPGFRATQAAMRKAQVPMLDYLTRLHKEVDLPFFKGLDKETRAMIFRAIETMTPSEVIDRGFFRPLNSNEINVANWMAEHHIDTARTLKYSRELLELEDRYVDDPEALAQATRELTERYKLDQDHVIAAATFNEIRKKNPNEIFIGHITRLADAIMSDAPSRADFIKEHNLPPGTSAAIAKLESILDEVANQIGLPQERRVRGWIAHFKAQMEPRGTLSQAFLGQRGLSNIPEMKFLNDLARTGEISLMELDPVLAATRYIRGAFLSQEFIPTFNNTLKTWTSEINKLPPGAREKVDRILKSYLSELRGIPEASVQFTDEVVRRLTEDMGMELTVDFRKNVVNTVIAASSGATMAGRLAMGLRDFASGWMVGTSWFGPARFSRMLKLGWDDAAVQALKAKGKLPPSLTPIEFSSPVDLQTSLLMNKLPGALNKVADVGLRASLQPLVYDRLNAGAYLEAHELASKVFSDLVDKKIDKAEAYKKIDLEVYEPSFIREFDGLVEGGKYEQAADLLGTQTQRMITPTYGLANHPYKWGTNIGRLIGQYGTWPTWLATNLLRMTSRGSLGTRTKVITRLAATQGAVYLAGRAMGFDLYSWFLLTGLRWLGGPVVGTTRALMNLFSPSAQEQASSKLELSRLVPSLSDPRSLYIPGSYFIGDWMQAVGALGDPARAPSNPVEFLGRGIGIPVSKDPSWLDYYLGSQ